MILLKLNEKYIKTYSFKVERSREKTFEGINLYLQNIEKGYSLLRTELIICGDVKIGDHCLEIAIRDGSPGYSFVVAGKITISIHEMPDRNESMLKCKV